MKLKLELDERLEERLIKSEFESTFCSVEGVPTTDASDSQDKVVNFNKGFDLAAKLMVSSSF